MTPTPALHPLQPIVEDANGTFRFKKNMIVDFLLEWCKARGMGLNELASYGFADEDRVQFAQLIGYSVGGFCDLSYVPAEMVEALAAMVPESDPKDAQILALSKELATLKAMLREPVARLYGISPADLKG